MSELVPVRYQCTKCKSYFFQLMDGGLCSHCAAIREAVDDAWNEALDLIDCNCGCWDDLLEEMAERNIPIRAAAPKSEDAK